MEKQTVHYLEHTQLAKRLKKLFSRILLITFAKTKLVEEPGFEPGTFRMRSGHSTTELHPRDTEERRFF